MVRKGTSVMGQHSSSSRLPSPHDAISCFSCFSFVFRVPLDLPATLVAEGAFCLLAVRDCRGHRLGARSPSCARAPSLRERKPETAASRGLHLFFPLRQRPNVASHATKARERRPEARAQKKGGQNIATTTASLPRHRATAHGLSCPLPKVNIPFFQKNGVQTCWGARSH
jgi:hypothetical protein